MRKRAPGRGGWLFPDEDGDWPDWNKARAENWTDAEYIEWRDSISEHGQALSIIFVQPRFPFVRPKNICSCGVIDVTLDILRD